MLQNTDILIVGAGPTSSTQYQPQTQRWRTTNYIFDGYIVYITHVQLEYLIC